MSPAQRRYLRAETVIAAAINAALSIAFVLVVFGGRQMVSTAELVRDAAAQSFFVTLFTVLVPGLLTRRRIRLGMLAAPMATTSRRRPLAIRAVAWAAGMALIAVALHAVLLPLAGADWRMPGVLLWKALYGAALGAAVARVTLPAEMSIP